MDKYKVRLEFKVITTNYSDVIVNANNKEDALNKALSLCDDGYSDLSLYASKLSEIQLKEDEINNFSVLKL